MTEAWVAYLTGPYGFIFAFGAGVLSFLSPCVLPLVPAYIAHLTGTNATLGDAANQRRRTVTHAVIFVLGFTAVFTFIGASVGLLGVIFSGDGAFAVRDQLPLLAKIAGVFLIIMGLNLIGIIRIPFLYRTYTLESATGGPPGPVTGGEVGAVSVGGGAGGGGSGAWMPAAGYVKSFGVGSAFAVGWTPCIGPVLGAILTLSAASTSVAQGAYLLLVYSLGLGLPFIITSLAVVPATDFLRRIRGAMPVIEIVTGVLVIFVGALIFLDELTIFNQYFDFFGLSEI
jgi:cytochrome c-type biogenesis protein